MLHHNNLSQESHGTDNLKNKNMDYKKKTILIIKKKCFAISLDINNLSHNP